MKVVRMLQKMMIGQNRISWYNLSYKLRLLSRIFLFGEVTALFRGAKEWHYSRKTKHQKT